MKYLLSSVALIVLFFVSTAYKNANAPDPEEFAKTLMSLIKKKDKQTYLTTHLVTVADVNWMVDQVNANPYMTIEEKEHFANNFGDTSRLNHLNEDLEGGYNKVTEWIQKENIDLNELVYIQLDYDLEFGPRKPFYVLDDSKLFVKHKDKFYCIRLDEAAFINGRWVAGRIKGIEGRDQYLNEEYYEYSEEYGVDSAATGVVAAEPMPEEYYAIDSAVPSTEVLTKKQQKLERKIEVQQKKLWKLLDEKYK